MYSLILTNHANAKTIIHVGSSTKPQRYVFLNTDSNNCSKYRKKPIFVRVHSSDYLACRVPIFIIGWHPVTK